LLIMPCRWGTILLLPAFALAACASATPNGADPIPQESPSAVAAEFIIQSISPQVSAGLPASVKLQVDGLLSDPCSHIAGVKTEQLQGLIGVEIIAARPEGTACTPAQVPHAEIVDLGQFETAGTYQFSVNGMAGSFVVGQGSQGNAPLDSSLNQPVRSPDGALTIMAPAGWAHSEAPGVIVLAASSESLQPAPGQPSARLALTLLSGAHAAMDFGLQNASLAEAYAYVVASQGLMLGAPRPTGDAYPWPGVSGQARHSQLGDRLLIVFDLGQAGLLSADAQAPSSQWPAFEALIPRIIATLTAS
jgi:hypothetical protein